MNLPNDIIIFIKTFIPYNALILTNRSNYEKYHSLINIRNYNNYITNIIQNDYDFSFSCIIRENINNWLRRINIMHKNAIFKNYIYYVMRLCIEYNALKCGTFLHNFLSERKLCRNLHKKKVIKYIK